MGQKLSALTFAPDLGVTDLFYMAEDLGGGIFFERKVEMSQLDSRYVNTSGDTMTGALDMGGFKITNLGVPTLGGDATNKTYVDSLIAGGAPIGATYITQIPNATLTNEQALSLLATGILKNTTTTGVLTIATAGTDYESPLTFSAPLIRTVNAISITQSGAGSDGYLSSVDWNTFNDKQPALGFTPENVANKATDFSVVNHTLYPSVQATKTYVDALVAAGAPPFIDTTPLVKGSVTPTKLLRFEVDGLSVGTRVLMPQDADYILAGTDITNDFSVHQEFTSANFGTGAATIDAAGSYVGPLVDVETLLTVQTGAGAEASVRFRVHNTDTITNVFEIFGSGQVLGVDGAAITPTYSFISEPTIGIYRVGLGTVGVSGSMSVTGIISVPDGNDLTPSYNFTSSGNTGMYLDPGAALGFSFGGNTKLLVNAAGISVIGDVVLSGNVDFPDDIRQTFNPGATVAGFNFGSVASDPSTPINGDAWYQSTANELRFQINGATVSFGASSVPPFTDTNPLIKGSADSTKLMRFEVDGFTTGVTRVLTPQNSDYILAGTNIANTFSVTQTFAPSTVNTSMILGTTYSLTGSNATNMIDLAGTWNTSGTPTAIKLNITNIASNAASLLFDLQASTLTKFNVSALGMTTLTRVNSSATLNLTDPHLLFNNTSSQSMMVFAFSGTARGGLRADSSGNFSWHASGSQGHQFYSGTTAIDANCICGFSASGVVIGNATAGSVSVARLDVISKSTTNIGQILKQLAGQTENMLQVRDSANTVLARLTAGGGFVFNENAADIDCRIEGDTNANLFFTDASTDRVGIGTATPSTLLHVNGALTSGNITQTVAALLSITSGTNQRAGNATLVAGTITVNNTTVTANTIVMLTRKTSGGTIGTAITYTVTAATSFTITSDSVLDTSTFSYLLIEVP